MKLNIKKGKMKPLLYLVIVLSAHAQARIDIARDGQQILLSWPTNWALQSAQVVDGEWRHVATGGTTIIQPTNQSAFFRAASFAPWEMMAWPTLTKTTNTVQITNSFVIARGSNAIPTKVSLAVKAPEPFPTEPTFRVWGGQARLYKFYGESDNTFWITGNYDPSYGYMIYLEVQDPITTPLVIRVLGFDAGGVRYEGYARFTNP